MIHKKTKKKYKGGQMTIDEKIENAQKDEHTFNFKDELTKIAVSTPYNVNFMNKILKSNTFTNNGYFVNNILTTINDNMNACNNYYSLCIIIRLFYSKDIGNNQSLFRLPENIIKNCITISHLTKQKELINLNNDTDVNIIRKLLIGNNSFFNFLQKFINDSNPINKLNIMSIEPNKYSEFSTDPLCNKIFFENFEPLIIKENETKEIKPLEQIKIGGVRYKSKKRKSKKRKRITHRSIKKIKGGSSFIPNVITGKKSILNDYQEKIEKLFIIDKINYSYTIPFLLNNILNKIFELKVIHNKIPLINNDKFCDTFYKKLEENSNKTNPICNVENVINKILT
jgi:hypothetical protein